MVWEWRDVIVTATAFVLYQTFVKRLLLQVCMKRAEPDEKCVSTGIGEEKNKNEKSYNAASVF